MASDLEIALKSAFEAARRYRHQGVTVEHLLLYLLDSDLFATHLEQHGIAVARLRCALAEAIMEADGTSTADPRLTMRLQEVIEAAVVRVQSKRRHEVSAFDVLGVLLDQNYPSKASKLLSLCGSADSIRRLRGHAV